MAAKQNAVVSAAREGSADELKKALGDWDNYMASGNLPQTLFLQYDVELFNKVNELQKNYVARYYNIVPSEQVNAMEQEEAIWPKVIEIQELINKRLEEL